MSDLLWIKNNQNQNLTNIVPSVVILNKSVREITDEKISPFFIFSHVCIWSLKLVCVEPTAFNPYISCFIFIHSASIFNGAYIFFQGYHLAYVYQMYQDDLQAL